MCKVQAGEEAEAAALITIVGLLLQGHKAHKGCSAGFFRLSALSLTYINTERGKGEGEPGWVSELARLQFQLGVFMATTAEWELQCRHPFPLHPPPPSAPLDCLATLVCSHCYCCFCFCFCFCIFSATEHKNKLHFWHLNTVEKRCRGRAGTRGVWRGSCLQLG